MPRGRAKPDHHRLRRRLPRRLPLRLQCERGLPGFLVGCVSRLRGGQAGYGKQIISLAES